MARACLLIDLAPVVHYLSLIIIVNNAGNIEDITCLCMDADFIFEFSSRYLKSERNEQVKYRLAHQIKIRIHKWACNILFIL